MLRDSKAYYLTAVKANLKEYEFQLGLAMGHTYVHDPRMLAFILARYKFAAKMLAKCTTAIEVGCGPAFGSPLVAQSVKKLLCTDVDTVTIQENRTKYRYFRNITFQPHDFRLGQLAPVDAIYLIDVIEHIFPEEEATFMDNLSLSLKDDGILLIGTPNKTAAAYASVHSHDGHVNLKSHDELYVLVKTYCKNVFMFGMNDEILHTGFPPMAHYLWALGVGIM